MSADVDVEERDEGKRCERPSVFSIRPRSHCYVTVSFHCLHSRDVKLSWSPRPYRVLNELGQFVKFGDKKKPEV